jgi:hypothetical protein
VIEVIAAKSSTFPRSLAVRRRKTSREARRSCSNLRTLFAFVCTSRNSSSVCTTSTAINIAERAMEPELDMKSDTKKAL